MSQMLSRYTLEMAGSDDAGGIYTFYRDNRDPNVHLRRAEVYADAVADGRVIVLKNPHGHIVSAAAIYFFDGAGELGSLLNSTNAPKGVNFARRAFGVLTLMQLINPPPKGVFSACYADNDPMMHILPNSLRFSKYNPDKAVAEGKAASVVEGRNDSPTVYFRCDVAALPALARSILKMEAPISLGHVLKGCQAILDCHELPIFTNHNTNKLVKKVADMHIEHDQHGWEHLSRTLASAPSRPIAKTGEGRGIEPAYYL